MSTPVGSVTAEIILDSKEFNEAITKLKEEVTSLKEVLNSNKGTSNLQKDVEKLKKEINSLTEKNKSYQETIDQLREKNKELATSTKNSANELKNEQKALDTTTQKADKAAKAMDRLNKSVQQNVKSSKRSETNPMLVQALANEMYSVASDFEKQGKYHEGKLRETKEYFKKIVGEEFESIIKEAFVDIVPDGAFGRNWAEAMKQMGMGLSVNERDYDIQNLKKPIQEVVVDLEKLKKELADAKNPLSQFVEAFLKGFAEIGEASFKTAADVKKLISTFADTGKSLSASEEFSMTLRGLANYMKQLKAETNLYEKDAAKFAETLYQTGNYVEQNKIKLELLHTGYNKLTESIVRTTEVLKTFNFALLEGVDKESIFYQRTVQLASAMQRMNSQGTENWAGRGQFGYSQYIQQISQMNAAMEKQKQIQQSIKQQALDQYYAKVNSASYKYWTQLREGTVNLNTYKSQMTQINNLLNQQTQRTERLASVQHQLYQKYHTTNLNTYKANMNEINRILAEQTSKTKQTEQATRQAGRGLTSFNNGVVQTAHSGRILSNTLYQIRGALLSLKMIFTAMGGMMLWGFAMDLAEGVKTTFTAKNEIEAQLNANAKVGASGINTFNKALDETISKFKKINKYTLGETVSSIGLEFELTAKQMEKAMPIVAMIQSEYVRAGRTSEEAALAVKDILQGEFQRLSRETGVGKEELLAYGWSGDKTDIDSLLKALEKAATDRNWDLFASKATSLNDVIEITKSRFSEFGADLLQTVSPMIVGAFNTIVGTLEWAINSFNSLSSFWQNFAVFGGAGVLFGGILTALPMITKGMGLAEIATIGWGKSILTAALNLNKAEVAQYGFRKALSAVITGTRAEELATVSSSKAILGRLLGVNQSILKQEGFASALMASRAALKGESEVMALTAASSMNLRQKLTYLVGNISLADAKTVGWAGSIKAIITSTKLWRIALLGITGIGLAAWLSSVAVWADTVKQRIDAFNEVVDNGDEMVKDAQATVDSYTEAISKLTEGTNEYNRAVNNKKQAVANLEDIKKANELAKAYQKSNEELEKSNQLQHQAGLRSSYERAGMDYAKATETASGYTEKVRLAQYEILHAEEEKAKFEYASLQHINEHLGIMEQQNASEEEKIKYISEYNLKAEEAANHLKEFNRGDLTAGIYYLLDRLALMWIDLWTDTHFTQFWNSVKQTWNDLKPTLYAIKDALLSVGQVLLDFFSTKTGQIVGGIAATGLAFGTIGIKIYHLLGGAKSTIDIIKTLGGKLKNVAGRWKDVGDAAEEANKKMGGELSTGGIQGGTEKDSGGSFKSQLGTKLKQDATNYARAAVAIAAAMVLVTEAILLIKLPMGALAEVGSSFKSLEPNIRAGVEGLKLIAPVMAVLLPPIIALMLLTNKYATSFDIIPSFATSAELIAMGMLLVAEAVVMLVAPMGAIAVLGWVKGMLGNSVEQGKEAIQLVTDTLTSLYPIIPVFIAAIVLGAIGVFSGGIGFLTEVAVIAGGMAMVAVAVASLALPLLSIEQLGQTFPDLSGVQQGAEAIKITAEAMGYVSDALGLLCVIEWELIADYIGILVGKTIGIDLTSLTGEGGFFEQLKTFTEEFNKIEITPIDSGKVNILAESATGLDSVKQALNTVKDALQDLPNFDVDNRSTNERYQDAVNGESAVEGISNYFEQLKKPIEQLNEFINKFNTEINIQPVDADKVAILQGSADAIGTIKSAIDNVKQAIGAAVDAQWNANVATGGLIGGAVGLLVGNGEIAGSSIKSGLDELYNCVKDIMDFNERIAGLTSTGSGNQEGTVQASNMVSALQTEINNLKTTLSSSIPAIKESAKGLGAAIPDGIREGISSKVGEVQNALGTLAENLGRNTMYPKFKSGIDQMSDSMYDELSQIGQAIDNRKEELGQKAYDLGKYMSDRFNEGYDHHSPGLLARGMEEELGYIGQYFNDAMVNLPQQAYMLSGLLNNNFRFDIGLSNIELPDVVPFQEALGGVTTTVSDMRLKVSTDFNTIKTNVANSFTSITTKTRTSLADMQTQTTKNITGIKTSWAQMQTALIQSAENIRSQTSQKINNLRDNMASFWRKVQNPALLLGGAGSPSEVKHTIQRRSLPKSISGSAFRAMGSGSSKPMAGGRFSKPMAGTSGFKFAPDFQYKRDPNRKYKTFGELVQCIVKGGTDCGVSRAKDNPVYLSKREQFQRIIDYFTCRLNGGNCIAGGWDFDWTKEIKDALMQWHTHFGEIYDDVLRVGKFEHDDFPVRGNATIAKRYIYDAISKTNYEFYYDTKYGSALAAWLNGSFNCVEGAMVAIALAEAFGFGGGVIRYGTWDGVGHGFADIPGLGIIDATAIQNGYGFTSPKVSGYGSPSIISSSAKKAHENKGETNNYGDVNVTINVYGDDVEVNENKVDKTTAKSIIDILGINPHTGI